MANSTNNRRPGSGSSNSNKSNRSANGKVTVSRSNSASRNTNSRSGSSANRNSSSNRSGSRNSSNTRSASSKSSNSNRNTNNRNGNTSRQSVNRNTGRPMSRKKQKQQQIKKYIMIAEIILIIVIVIAGVSFFRKSKDNTIETVSVEKPVEPVHVKVDGVDISSMSKEQAKAAILQKHNWSFKVTYNGNVYDVDNLFEKEIDAVLYDAFAPNAKPEYTITISNPENSAASIAKTVSDMWSQPAVDAAITGYNAETGEFVLSESQPGYVVNVEQLTADIAKELAAGNYSATVEAKGESSNPTFSKSDYKVLGTYSTTTTSNADRNTNVRIACETICGTILQPQEQFSYNTILGRRTAEKGYKEAGAYANGEHVMELGGGICQVSSTIYNATIFANLQIDKRTGHTYEPTYVTPGEDAAVSYTNPDFVFTNNTGATLGIKTTFADRKIVATIFGISTLEEGVKRYMRSEKVGDVPPPEDVVVEDPMLFPGQTQVVKGPKNGSKWATYIILEKDGNIISEEYLHTTTYRGHGGEIHVNNSGVVDPAVIAAQQAAAQAAAQQAEAAAAQQAAQQAEQPAPAPEAPPAE